MTRVNLLLLLVLVASSIYLVNRAYESRRLFTAKVQHVLGRQAHGARRLCAGIDRAQAEQRRLDHEHERLLAERQTEARPLRVERLAREKLAMQSASPAVTQFVRLESAAASEPGRGGRP